MLAPFEASFAERCSTPRRPFPTAVAAADAQYQRGALPSTATTWWRAWSNALKSRFPVVEKIVGEEFFAAMARAFVTEKPPRSPLLAGYGDEFPAFIAAFAPARELPYLADVAQLEAARTRAYHAADAVPVDAGAFAALDPWRCRRAPHRAASLHRNHPLAPSHRHDLGDECRRAAARPIEDWRGEDALVTRPHLDVEVRLLPPGGAAFLLALAAGRTLADAAATARADHSEFDLAGNLAGLIGWGVAGKVILPAPPETD